MLLDLRRLFASYDAPLVRDCEFDFSEEELDAYCAQTPVQTHMVLTKEGSMLRMELSVQATLQTECARCLDSIAYEADFTRTFFIREDEGQREDTELPVTPAQKLDVRELVYAELVLELPRTVLCRETCEGLCPVCGIRMPCACTQETSGAVDERLSMLQQLLILE